jgi:hypothetical protein
MTNYKRWDSFDVDAALDEVESNEDKSVLKTASLKATKTTIERQTSLHREAQNAAEFRDIKESVTSLIAMGNRAGYYRLYKKACKTAQPPTLEVSSTLTSTKDVDSEDTDIPPHVPETLTEKMLAIADQLGDAVLLVQQLQKSTEVRFYTLYFSMFRDVQ